ncbi:MAG: hypothetical protein J2P23_13690, partial [Microlunatus sp.]|nr:hypothetical protein [Microlunatus sp.]
PSGVRPTSFGTDQRRLIIGGRQGTGPWLATIDPSDRIAPVALSKHSPYAFTGEFVSIAIFGDRIAALGNVHGGAHGNSRWTVWTGDTTRITEYPQSLDTFGGVDGGDLAAVVINNDGPLITGSYRFGAPGLDGGIWLPAGVPIGRRWAQPDPTGTDLDTTRSVLVSVQTAAADQDQVVLAGSTTSLQNGVHQVATVWTRPDGTHWKRVELPRAGRRSEALSLSCWSGPAGQVRCLIAGTVDGRLAAWQSTGTTATRVTGLPAPVINPEGPRPTVVAGPTHRAIAFDTGTASAMVVAGQGRWSTIGGPPGRLVSAAARGRTAYVITQSRGSRTVSRAELP